MNDLPERMPSASASRAIGNKTLFAVPGRIWYNAEPGEDDVELSSEQLERVRSLAGTYPIRMVLLFGSALSPGKEHARSDLDVAVAFDGSVPDLRALAELGHGLQEIFPEREVDLAVLNYADPLLLKKIAENCLLVYGEPQRLAEFKIYAYKRFQDHRRYFEMERAFVKRYLESRRRAG